MALVSADVTEEELEEALRKIDEDRRWKSDHPGRGMTIDALSCLIIALERLSDAIRNTS